MGATSFVYVGVWAAATAGMPARTQVSPSRAVDVEAKSNTLKSVIARSILPGRQLELQIADCRLQIADCRLQISDGV
jgi:hypothetical protein